MIQQALGGMLTLMLAKFILNDVPHALELSPKEAVTYRMQCPQCAYSYRVTPLGGPYEWERCPICGHGAPFMEFVKPGGDM